MLIASLVNSLLFYQYVRKFHAISWGIRGAFFLSTYKLTGC